MPSSETEVFVGSPTRLGPATPSVGPPAMFVPVMLPSRYAPSCEPLEVAASIAVVAPGASLLRQYASGLSASTAASYGAPFTMLAVVTSIINIPKHHPARSIRMENLRGDDSLA